LSGGAARRYAAASLVGLDPASTRRGRACRL